MFLFPLIAFWCLLTASEFFFWGSYKFFIPRFTDFAQTFKTIFFIIQRQNLIYYLPARLLPFPYQVILSESLPLAQVISGPRGAKLGWGRKKLIKMLTFPVNIAKLPSLSDSISLSSSLHLRNNSGYQILRENPTLCTSFTKSAQLRTLFANYAWLSASQII